MKIAQQIVGVNQRLGNTAVPNMQGTTRVIYDTIAATGTDNRLTFFSGVSSRNYPLSNISSNRFEVGESLAIQGFSILSYSDSPTLASPLAFAAESYRGGILNFFIGNQRVIKDLEIATYSRFNLGEAISETTLSTVFRLETPIVIPPQIEFYATLRFSSATSFLGVNVILSAFGTGTLLNTKSTF